MRRIGRRGRLVALAAATASALVPAAVASAAPERVTALAVAPLGALDPFVVPALWVVGSVLALMLLVAAFGGRPRSATGR